MKTNNGPGSPPTSTPPPEERVARLFMERKGLGDLQPIGREKVQGEPCWYFYYEVDGNRLELEVAWTQPEGGEGAWETTVTSFNPL